MRHAREDYSRIQDPSGKIPADEPVFLIRAQDKIGAQAVRAWADLNRAAGGNPDITSLARGWAIEMEQWPTRKLADLPAQPTEGWGWPPNSLKAHYFTGGISLCRRWMYSGELNPGLPATSLNDCKECRRQLEKRRQKAESRA